MDVPATSTAPAAGPGDAPILALVSEELRGPLTSVVGYLQVLLDGEVGELTAGQARMAEVAARNAERMQRMVDDLVVVAEVLSGGLSAAPGPVDLAALVEERVAAAVPAAAARRVRLTAGVARPVRLTGDLPALAHMVDALIAGVVAFSPAGTAVRVALRPWRDGAVRIEVAPDGEATDALPPGATRALAPRLGPALVRAVAERHGGRVEEDGGEGARTVRVVLPAPAPAGMRTVDA